MIAVTLLPCTIDICHICMSGINYLLLRSLHARKICPRVSQYHCYIIAMYDR